MSFEDSIMTKLFLYVYSIARARIGAWCLATRQSLVALGHSDAEAADEASIVRSQLAYAASRAGKTAAAAEQLKQVVRSRCDRGSVMRVVLLSLVVAGLLLIVETGPSLVVSQAVFLRVRR